MPLPCSRAQSGGVASRGHRGRNDVVTIVGVELPQVGGIGLDDLVDG